MPDSFDNEVYLAGSPQGPSQIEKGGKMHDKSTIEIQPEGHDSAVSIAATKWWEIENLLNTEKRRAYGKRDNELHAISSAALLDLAHSRATSLADVLAKLRILGRFESKSAAQDIDAEKFEENKLLISLLRDAAALTGDAT